MSSAWTLDLVLTLLTKGSLLLVLAWVISHCFRRVSAAGRHVVWLAALTSLLLLPVLANLLPERPLAWLPSSKGVTSTALPSDSTATALAEGVIEDSVEVPAVVDVSVVEVSTARSSFRGTSAGPATDNGQLPWSLLLTILWAIGTAWLGFRLIWGLLSLGRLRRQARPLEHPALASTFEAVGERLVGPRTVEVLSHPEIESPCTWGWRRPVVLLPTQATSWGKDHLREVLVHELAHVTRRDWLGYLLASFVCALCWFHPLVWLAASRLRLEAERACDDLVLTLGASAPDYADRLLQMARRLRRRGRPATLFALTAGSPAGSALEMARHHQLSHRIAAILNPRLRRHSMNRSFFWIATCLSLALLTVIAPWTLVQAQSYGDLDDASAQLMQAAAAGDLNEIRSWIALGADVNARQAREGTPLILAAHHGDPQMVAALLEAGADPNLVEGKGPRTLARSPLNAAARSGHPEVIRLLLAAGAEVDKAPRGDATPLMAAARHGHDEAAELLLTHGADADRRILGDGTPLIEATRAGDAPLVERLLEAGANPNHEVRGDGSPLIAASRRGYREIVVRLLEAGADPNGKVWGDGSPLIVASREGYAEIVERLLEAGADPDLSVWGDGSPLIAATRRGHGDIVASLLAAGADPDNGVMGDGNPLIAASRAGRQDIVTQLIEAGADVDESVHGDGNALLNAAAKGDSATVEALLDAGADPNAAVRGDGNALIMAARGGHTDLVSLLLDHGAAIDEVVPGDENPLIQAAGRGHLDTVQLLIERGADVNRQVTVSSWRDGNEIRSPLSMARKGGHDEVVDLLLRSGASS